MASSSTSPVIRSPGRRSTSSRPIERGGRGPRTAPDGPRRHVPPRPARARRHWSRSGPAPATRRPAARSWSDPGGQGKGHPRGRSEERRPDPRAGGRQRRPADRRGQGHALVDALGSRREGTAADEARPGACSRRTRPAPTAGSCSATSGRRSLTRSWSRPGGTTRPRPPR